MKIIIEKNGQIRLPQKYIDQYEIETGTEIYLEPTEEGIILCRPIPDVRKVYIEPTSRCNLNCITCMRNVWKEKTGDMYMNTFNLIFQQLKSFKHLRAVALAGFGEPLYHPNILIMARHIKDLGVELSISTNGVLLAPIAEDLVESGVDKIIVSIDSVNSLDFASIRNGASLNGVLDNIRFLNKVKRRKGSMKPVVGIEFVAMRRNIEEITELPKLASSLGAAFVLITNLLPHSEDMCKEILYDGTTELSSGASWPVAHRTWLQWATLHRPKMYWGASRRCRFVEEKAFVIGWDGKVSPCYALMHSYPYYIFNRRKQVTRYVLGDVHQENLMSIWMSREYVRFRDKVRIFDFPSCVDCGLACDIAENNEDCYTNVPSCADCLWAQDIVRCP
ncbi:TPA: tungsten cofactor oxidoreductase radical SAM maturase [Candidatus Poribacteria bacterium]|nr:tungsten cofactor oxidoreductase radical SAM maturase [Candidatus Poribacteria bacterium]